MSSVSVPLTVVNRMPREMRDLQFNNIFNMSRLAVLICWLLQLSLRVFVKYLE